MNTKKTWIKNLDTKQDVEYIKAFFSIDKRYSSHRHDTYAIGITFSGVQSFHYRKEMQHSLPWHAMILHPDEAHDGFAGSDAGFYYHMLYIKPEKIQEILQGKPLPFINEGISQDRYLINSIYQLMQSFENTEELLQIEDAMYDLTMNLYRSSGVLAGAKKIINDRSVRQAKDYMLDNLTSFLTLDDIASQVNVDKWSLSRDFRLLLGTSPHRYITMRRLEIVKKLLLAGMGFADSSISAGFFDQSHMIRHFKKTFGLSPSQWLGLFSSN